MFGRLIFMFIGCITFSFFMIMIEKFIGVDFGIIPYCLMGFVWGIISDDVLAKLQENGFFNKLK